MARAGVTSRKKAAPRAKAASKKAGKGKRKVKGKAAPMATAAPKKKAGRAGSGRSTSPTLGTLRSCIYQVDDLEKAKAFYSAATGKQPYFDEPFYVGFDLGGFELGLDPDVSKRQPGGGGSCGYWKVSDINATWKHLTAIGAQSIELPHNVGGDTHVSVVADPFGNYIGLIQEG
jgi:predicted enzyme related to lactoylglutathione lyase